MLVDALENGGLPGGYRLGMRGEGLARGAGKAGLGQFIGLLTHVLGGLGGLAAGALGEEAFWGSAQ